MFDHVAQQYDQIFTHSQIGRIQREQVHHYLNSIIRKNGAGDVLELNAGTGEDAIFFARKAWHVKATDISESMIEIAKKKANEHELSSLIEFAVCDINKLNELKLNKKYDLVFSNFGGLNCLNRKELSKLALQLAALLKPHGRFIAVIMPRFCLWESVYFMLKMKLKEAFRRSTRESVHVPVGNEQVATWYYTPAEFAQCFDGYFRKMALRPVGVFVPPSYLEKWFSNKPGLLSMLNLLDKRVSQVAFFAYISDHYLIELQPA